MILPFLEAGYGLTKSRASPAVATASQHTAITSLVRVSTTTT